MTRELKMCPRRHLCDTCQCAKACEASRRKRLDLTHAKAFCESRSKDNVGFKLWLWSCSSTGAMCLSSNAAQMSLQRSSNVSLDTCLPRIPGRISPTSLPSSSYLHIWVSILIFLFFHLLRHGILLWLYKSPTKPAREGRSISRSDIKPIFAQIQALRSHLRSPPIDI